MKWLISVLLLISFKCNAQEYSEQQMQQKTLQAIAKFYKLDIIGQETVRRIEEKYIPKEMHAVIPYLGVIQVVIIEKRIVYRKNF